jgi:ubiquinone/menaquinone biosynthesis C-methylase UbiE
MDYDLTDIPEGYDRGRDHGAAFLRLWMDVIAAQLEGRTVTRILDLGCGTGRFTAPLATAFGVEVIGVDPSKKMLERAREKRHPNVRYELGPAESIPLPDRSVDVVFMSMCFHHFGDRNLAGRECRRVLRDDGTLLVRTGTREQIESYASHPFFPSSRAMMEEILPDVPTLRGIFEAAGFRFAAAQIVVQEIAPSWSAHADKLAAGGDSVIARLDRAELERGLIAMRNHGAGGDAQPILEPVDLLVFRPRQD